MFPIFDQCGRVSLTAAISKYHGYHATKTTDGEVEDHRLELSDPQFLRTRITISGFDGEALATGDVDIVTAYPSVRAFDS